MRVRSRWAVLLAMLLAVGCREDEVQQVQSPVDEFANLLGKRQKGAIVSSAESARFLELIEDHAEVRRYIADRFSGMNFVQQADIGLALRSTSKTATFPEFHALVLTLARDNTSPGRTSAIYALRAYDLPERQDCLRTLIQDRPVHEHFHSILAALKAHLDLYGADGIEEEMEAILSAQCAAHKRYQLAAVVASRAKNGHGTTALEIVNDMLADGFGESKPAIARKVFTEMVSASQVGDDRLKEHAERFAEEGTESIQECAKSYLAKFYAD